MILWDTLTVKTKEDFLHAPTYTLGTGPGWDQLSHSVETTVERGKVSSIKHHRT